MAAVWVWLAVAAAYMVLAGQFSLDEVAAAAALGVFGALWHRAVLGAGARRFSVDGEALVAIGRAIAGLVPATVEVGARLAFTLADPAQGRARGTAQGRRVERPFTGGRQGDPREAGRRAIAVLATSLAPDAYVLRVPLDEDTILYHAITDHVPGGDPRWPA